MLGYVAYVNEWDFAKAERNLARALDLESGSPQWLRLYGDVAAVRKNFQDAEERLNAGQRILPDSLVIRHARAMLAFHHRDYRKAAVIARELTQRKPDYPLAYWIAGLAAEQQGHSAEALSQFDTCLKLSPGDPRCVRGAGRKH